MSSKGNDLKQFWRDNRLLVTGFALALAVMLFFALRTVSFWIYWNDPAHRNQDIEGWMTPRYVAHSWAVPPKVVADVMGLEPGGPRVTLHQMAENRGETLDALVARIMAAILAHRAEREARRP
ncbi:hypothetical protein [Phaeobacter sp. J2-8]|uniref:hypothetical protein n=1 Tax=Phaeobacter sp. J2-8 TaxID=2931394 RepID=UPI001FD39C8C|nr:hypothetical protein [Phaeobacter sp. J2-8]MCJ7873598.1 hypothetical protein [Phaeobacter sp. J2-8]